MHIYLTVEFVLKSAENILVLIELALIVNTFTSDTLI